MLPNILHQPTKTAFLASASVSPGSVPYLLIHCWFTRLYLGNNVWHVRLRSPPWLGGKWRRLMAVGGQ